MSEKEVTHGLQCMIGCTRSLAHSFMHSFIHSLFVIRYDSFRSCRFAAIYMANNIRKCLLIDSRPPPPSGFSCTCDRAGHPGRPISPHCLLSACSAIAAMEMDCATYMRYTIVLAHRHSGDAARNYKLN